MHTLAMPKSILSIELGPQRPLALYELAYLIKKKKFTYIALLCNVPCREGVQCNVVYLGGFSIRG